MTASMHVVFVYGTLKNGEPNHHWLTSAAAGSGTARLLGSGRTGRPFPLVVAAPYGIPYCLDRPEEGHHLSGEVYSIDEAKLRHLDELESYPTHYNRRLEEVTLLDSPEAAPLQAWIYLWEKYTDAHLTLPFLENYTSNGDYVPKERRSL